MATTKKTSTPKKAAPKKKVPKEKGVKKAVAKTATSAKSAAKKTAASADVLDPTRKWSLEELSRHVPPATEEAKAQVLALLLSAQSDADLLALGADYRTEDILATAPSFALDVLRALRVVKRPLPGLAPPLVPLFVDEARKLARINAAYEQELRSVSSTIEGLRARLKAANSGALRSRRTVAQTLTHGVIPHDSAHRAALLRAAGKAPTYASTAASVRAVADILEQLLADPAFAKGLALYEYTAAHVTELRAQADEVEALAKLGTELTPPQETDQRALDRQDGLVLAIMRAIWVPLRAARSDGAPLSLPAVGALERLFIRSRSSGVEDGDDDEETVVAGP